jgi:tetratricopeptide (TPR) repeat protein
MNFKSTYDHALELERGGNYGEAFTLFERCTSDSSLDEGRVMFQCGWCVEQVEGPRSERALGYYEESTRLAGDPGTRMNAAFRAGWIEFHRKEYGDALKWFDVASKIEIGIAEDIRSSAIYWKGVCLEAVGRLIDAIAEYRTTRELSPHLNPEARVREMYCLIAIGDFEAALGICQTFGGKCPPMFSEDRYKQLSAEVRKEGMMLQECISGGSVSAR